MKPPFIRGRFCGCILFNAGELVDVIGASRGRGYQGVMKRHFAGTPRSHGTHESFRHGGSIGMATYPGRVLPGAKMAGQMGNVRKTILNQGLSLYSRDLNPDLYRRWRSGAMNSVVVIRKATRFQRSAKASILGNYLCLIFQHQVHAGSAADTVFSCIKTTFNR